MRLWPYQMLDVLPYRQLLSQWRECLAVAGMINSENGINHATINRVKDYPIEHFAFYCELVRREFLRREWTIGTNTIEKLNNDINFENLKYDVKEIKNDYNITEYIINNKKLFQNYHNERHIKQCLFSFQEKLDCEMLSEKEWKLLVEKFKYLGIDL